MSLQRLKIAANVFDRGRVGRVFTATDYKQLLELLQSTKLRHLELACLQRIPDTPANLQIGSLQLLRLSGSCTFKDSVRFLDSLFFSLSLTSLRSQQTSFRNLFTLLSSFPSLAQLHLNGDYFFGTTSTAHEMSSHSEMSLLFDYPELGSLLTYLRRSTVVIFTYRGEYEEREMRWTRLTKDEEFDRDCWTL